MMVFPTIVNLNMNYNYPTIALVTDLIIIGYFSYQTTQYCLKRYNTNLSEVIDQLVNKVAEENLDDKNKNLDDKNKKKI